MEKDRKGEYLIMVLQGDTIKPKENFRLWFYSTMYVL